MAFAFANNTQNLNSSDKISYSKSKTNYNYLRLVSLKQNLDNKQPICSSDKYFSSSGVLLVCCLVFSIFKL